MSLGTVLGIILAIVYIVGFTYLGLQDDTECYYDRNGIATCTKGESP